MSKLSQLVIMYRFIPYDSFPCATCKQHMKVGTTYYKSVLDGTYWCSLQCAEVWDICPQIDHH